MITEMKAFKFLLLIIFTPYVLASQPAKHFFIGTWEIEGVGPFKSFVIYHPPHTYKNPKNPIEFEIKGYGNFVTSDIMYGRYDVLIEFKGNKKRLIADSGIWFHPLDRGDNYMFDVRSKDVDIDNFKFPQNIKYPSHGFAITRIIYVDNDIFSFEEYDPNSNSFNYFRAIRAKPITLNEILKLPYHDEL